MLPYFFYEIIFFVSVILIFVLIIYYKSLKDLAYYLQYPDDLIIKDGTQVLLEQFLDAEKANIQKISIGTEDISILRKKGWSPILKRYRLIKNKGASFLRSNYGTAIFYNRGGATNFLLLVLHLEKKNIYFEFKRWGSLDFRSLVDMRTLPSDQKVVESCVTLLREREYKIDDYRPNSLFAFAFKK